MTRRGIEYNLEISPYTYKLENITYYFSSTIYRNNFIENYENNRKLIGDKLFKRYGLKIEYNEYFDLILYSIIEKRGFYIKVGDKPCQKVNNLTLNGGKLTIQD